MLQQMHLCQFLRFPAEMKIAFCNRSSMAQSHEHRIKIAAVSLVGLADVIRTAWVPFKRKANCQPLVGALLLIAVCCQLKNIPLQLSWTECSCKLKWLRVNLGLCQMMMHHTSQDASRSRRHINMSGCPDVRICVNGWKPWWPPSQSKFNSQPEIKRSLLHIICFCLPSCPPFFTNIGQRWRSLSHNLPPFFIRPHQPTCAQSLKAKHRAVASTCCG